MMKQFKKAVTPLVMASALSLVAGHACAEGDVKSFSFDSRDDAHVEAIRQYMNGVFPFVVSGGDNELKSIVDKAISYYGAQMPVAKIVIPDLDGDERHIAVQNIGRDGLLCTVHGYNGDLDSFKKVFSESIKKAYTSNCW